MNDTLEEILTSFNACYQWNYGDLKIGLRDLYEKAKREQWNASTALDWKTQVEPESEIIPAEFDALTGYGPYERLDAREQGRMRHAQLSMQLSQFLHAEQAGMIVASQLVACVPWMDAKHCAASQTIDEARHVEVFSRYVNEKLEWEWPITPALKEFVDTVIREPRWDFKYMGAQIMLEGLGLAAFGNLHQIAREPLLRSLLHNVMRDESRHIAAGVLSLRSYYADMSGSELRDREDFVIYGCELMRNRFRGGDFASVMGWKSEDLEQHIQYSERSRRYRDKLFQRIVPNLKRLGLLTTRVQTAFDRLGILQFQTCDPEEQDRVLGFSS